MDISCHNIRISCVLNHILFPLTSPEIIDSLEKRAFQVGRPQIPVPSSQRSYMEGSIARKDGIFVNLNNYQKLFGVQGTSTDKALKIFLELLDILTDDFNVDLDNDIVYVELIGHYLVKTEKNPYEVITQSVEVKNKEKIESILKNKIVNYRMYLSPENISFQSPNWFEINISPRVIMADNAYWLESIYRNVKPDSVIEFTENINPTIERILETLEE